MDVSRSFAFVNAISNARNPAELGSHLVQLAQAFGFSSVYGGLVPRSRAQRTKIALLTLVQHVPSDWAARYNERGYLFRDPVFRRLLNDTQPFTWAESYASCPNIVDSALIAGEAADHGLKSGFVVPVLTLEEQTAAVSFGGDRTVVYRDDLHRLAFAASYMLHQSGYGRSSRRANTNACFGLSRANPSGTSPTSWAFRHRRSASTSLLFAKSFPQSTKLTQ